MKRDYVLGCIPRYAALPLLCALAWNTLIYNGSIFLTRNMPKLDMTGALEEAIPLQTGWIAVYFGCYLFWAVNYILVARRGEERWFRFFFAHLLAELICGICFVALPRTNLRPEVTGTGFADALVRLLYQIDPAQNLFPSIHCMLSWLCFAGLRSEQRLPVFYRVFCCLFALAVCASTLFLKQHCVPDVISGILLAEGTYALAMHTKCYQPLQRLFRRKGDRTAA